GRLARRMVGLLLPALLLAMLPAAASAAGHCDGCGCQSKLVRVCRPVHTTRPVETIVWDVVSEEYCLPGRGDPLLPCNDCAARGLDECLDCRQPRSRNRLIRKKRIEHVPTILWVVEYRCDDCAGPPPEM